MTIYLDFDGTIVEHLYPELGACNEGCFEVIRKLQQAGHHIILNTYRADTRDGTLEEAYYYLSKNKEKLHENITEHTSQKLTPHEWSADNLTNRSFLFIDDIAPGIPLIDTIAEPGGKMVDWKSLDSLFESHGLYEPLK